MKYIEKQEESKPFKENYVKDLKALIEKLQKDADTKRKEYIKDVFDEPEKYREDFKKILGWPLVGYEKTDFLPLKVKSFRMRMDTQFTVCK